MSVHVYLFLLVVGLFLLLTRLGRLGWFPLRPSHSRGGAKRSRLHRLLRPRCPDDCPVCRLGSPPALGGGTVSEPVRPWCEVKSRRGAPKRIDTEGFACPNPQCRYFRIIDARVHALVGDGKHGRTEPIQTFRCQACRTTFSVRRDTPLFRLKTPSQQIAMVLSALAEGLDLSAAERVFGFRQATITTWLTRAGEHAQTLHKRSFCHLHLPLYFYALTAHFGQWLQVGRRGRNVRQWQVEPGLIYGQVKKSYRRRKLVRVTHVMRLGTEPALKAALQGLGFSGRLNTAFIERLNLTIRHGVAALARRTWATSQQSPYLLAHLEWWRAYYHFVRPHQSLRVALLQPRARGGKLLPQCYRQRTPAMAAGRTHRRWTAREVLSCPLPRVSA